MMTLFREGGYSMFFVLGFGGAAFLWAAWYAARGKPARLAFVRGMMVATAFATLSGICSDLGTVFHRVAEEEDAVKAHHMVLEGSGESMAPGIMGFSLLALTALLVAVGDLRTRREDGP
jgi:hypothetical protein